MPARVGGLLGGGTEMSISDSPRQSSGAHIKLCLSLLIDTQAVRLAPFVRINHGWQPTKDRQLVTSGELTQ